MKNRIKTWVNLWRRTMSKRSAQKIVAEEGTKEERYVAVNPDPGGGDGKLSHRILLSSSFSRCIIRRPKNTWRKSLGRLAKTGAPCPRNRERSIYFWQRENAEDDAGEERREEEDVDLLAKRNFWLPLNTSGRIYQ